MLKELKQGLKVWKDFASAKEWLGKRWFFSKTLWVNVLMLIAILTENTFALSVEEQGAIVTVVNIILRLLTSQPLVTKEENIVNIKPCLPETTVSVSPKE